MSELQKRPNFVRAEKVEELNLAVGEELLLESLRVAVTPEYLMLMPFIELPEGVEVKAQEALDEDGVHGCVYHLQAKAPVDADIAVGFRDMKTGKETHRKVIHAHARPE